MNALAQRVIVVKRFFNIVTYRAATARKPAFFITPAHVTFQRVFHEVNAFKFGEFNRRDYKHADEHGSQR
jgi:hypothetical protein